MVEISTSILNIKKGEESATFFELEAAKTDYFHIDVMDGKFVTKDTYERMFEYASYIRRISNLPLDVHLMVENIDEAIYYLAKSIEFIGKVDIVVFMKGWEKARGCRIEHQVAVEYGKEIVYCNQEVIANE